MNRPESDFDQLPPEARDQLASLARRFRGADNIGVQILNAVGGQADRLVDRLPDSVKDQLGDATLRALTVANETAHMSRKRGPGDGRDWLNTALATGLGAAGGFGGLPTALAELPVTTTILLRAIQGIAAEHGFDTDNPLVRMQAIQVFGAAGPMARAQSADLAFLSARMTLTGAALHALIARVSPHLARVLGQKLAAQTVPVIGAAAGAATNFAYTSYYQDMARVYFGLRRLSQDLDVETERLLQEFRLLVIPPKPIS